MARAKETPRQKLIGMMYLVLTAMLALNVSKEVLDGYTAVNETVVNSIDDFSEKQKVAFDRLLKELTMNEIEVRPFWNKAKQASKLSSDMVKYIGDLRNVLVATTEKIPLDSASKLSMKDMRKKDNYTVPTHVMIGTLENGTKGKARELKLKLIEFKENMKSLVGPVSRKNLSLGLETEQIFKDASGKKEPWERHYFYDIPLAADVTILNKFITEVNNAELEVVNALLRESIAEDFKYDRIEAKVLPKTNYLFNGEEYEAEVIVAAYDTSLSPNVFMMQGVDSLSPVQRDRATKISAKNSRMNIRFPVNSLGAHKYAGYVSVPTAFGKERTYHFSSEYFVASPSLTVSPTNMNVLYIGVDNPLSISVSGVPMDKLIPSISSGNIRPNKNGGWIATVNSGSKEATVSVSIKTEKGIKKMGTFKFRVKKLPDPVPTLAGRNSGFLNRERIIESGHLTASMPSDFEFNINFRVISFKMSIQRGFNTYTYEATNANLTDEMIGQIQRTNRGQVLEFESILAVGPENEKRELPSFSITIK